MDVPVWVLLEEEDTVARRNALLATRRYRRMLRDHSNPLHMDTNLFIQAFRLNKESFKYILDELQNLWNTGGSITPIVKLSACLRFLAEGGYQRGVGNDFHVAMGRSTFSKVLKEFLNLGEEHLCPKWIKIEKSEVEVQRTKRNFFENTGFPGVIGCVDGTHVKIVQPVRDKHLFYCRKQYFSLNVMVVCDDQMRIMAVDSTHPGSCHDSAIWNVSIVKSYFERKYQNGMRNSWLLGDAGYGLEPYLMTPYRNTTPESGERRFNNKHIKCRNIVERTIGVLKNRFRCTLQDRTLHYDPGKSSAIVNVCCALHNICIFYKVPSNEDYDFQNEDESDDENETWTESAVAATYNRALAIRNQLKDSFQQ